MGHANISSTTKTQHTNQLNEYQLEINKKMKLYIAYLNKQSRDSNIQLPSDIQNLIIKDYCLQSLIYGAGSNKYGLFGLGHSNLLPQYTLLSSMCKLTPNALNIYHNADRILIQNINNEIFVSGFNKYNAFGIECNENNQFTKINTLNYNNIISFSHGSHNSEHIFVYYSNKHLLFASGYNNGQFGNGISISDKYETLTPVNISFIHDKIIDIKCGFQHSLLLTKNGKCFSFGFDGYGQCGHNKMKLNNYKCNISKPKQLIFSNKIICIATGTFYSLLINDKHQLICFGSNYFGQLGIKTSKNHKKCIYKPIINDYFNKYCIKLIDVKCNKTHSLCLDSNGNCYCFGRNNSGQIGNGYIENAVFKPFKININRKIFIQISCGNTHNILLSSDHRIICFGDNKYKQCSSMCKMDIIQYPYILSKENEFGMDELSFIEHVKALNYNSIIIINPYKRIKV